MSTVAATRQQDVIGAQVPPLARDQDRCGCTLRPTRLWAAIKEGRATVSRASRLATSSSFLRRLRLCLEAGGPDREQAQWCHFVLVQLTSTWTFSAIFGRRIHSSIARSLPHCLQK